MRASERAIVFGVVLAALAIGFYVLVLGPQRDKVSELSKQVDDLHASISREQQVADFAEQARRSFRATTGVWWCSGRPCRNRPIPPRCSCSSTRFRVAPRWLSRGSRSARGRIRPVPARLRAPARPRSHRRAAAPHPRLPCPGIDRDERRRATTTTSGTSGSAAPVSAAPAPATEASRGDPADRRCRRSWRVAHAPVRPHLPGHVLRHLQLHRRDRRSRHPAGRRDPGLLRRAAVHRQRIRLERRRARLLAQARRELPGDDLRDARGAGPDRRRHTERTAVPSAPAPPRRSRQARWCPSEALEGPEVRRRRDL